MVTFSCAEVIDTLGSDGMTEERKGSDTEQAFPGSDDDSRLLKRAGGGGRGLLRHW